MRSALLVVIVAAGGFAAAAASAACAQEPEKPSGDVIRLEGGERLQWDQAGPSLDAVNAYRYVAVVGRRPFDLQRVSCAARPSADGFVCTSELPPLASGVHQVWVIAVTTDEKRVLVSTWSSPLTVQKQ